jgi:hypothetical protein
MPFDVQQLRYAIAAADHGLALTAPAFADNLSIEQIGTVHSVSLRQHFEGAQSSRL